MMVLQNQPCWIRAVEDKGVLTVSHSPALPADDKAWAPIHEYLCTTCHDAPGAQASRWDKNMMFGQALVTTFKIHTRCPGASVHHVCGVSLNVKAG